MCSYSSNYYIFVVRIERAALIVTVAAAVSTSRCLRWATRPTSTTTPWASMWTSGWRSWEPRASSTSASGTTTGSKWPAGWVCGVFAGGVRAELMPVPCVRECLNRVRFSRLAAWRKTLSPGGSSSGRLSANTLESKLWATSPGRSVCHTVYVCLSDCLTY